jgi:N-acetylmuramoyl-L-alanine amidase
MRSLASWRARRHAASGALLVLAFASHPLVARAQGIDGPLRVRAGREAQVVATVTDAGARFVPVQALARVLGGRATATATGVRFEGAGVIARITVGARDVTVGTSTEMLVAAARRGADGVLVHETFVTDLLPRLGTGVVWDPEERELRQFSTFARKVTPPVAAAPTSEPVADAPPAADDPVTTALGAPGDRTLRPDADARPVRIGGAPASAGAPRAGDAPRSAPVADAPPSRTTAAARARRPRSVVVDAGHGGPDVGMNGLTADGRRVYEKDITLAVALLVGDLLRERGVQVHFTRTRDTLIALGDRGRIANARKADLFLSIHVNAANPGWRDPGGARGFETYFLAEAKTEDESRVEAMENASIRFETGVAAARNDPLSFIINDMAQNEHLRESNDLAGLVQRRLRGMHPGPDRGVKQANFAVLRTSFMPAVLIELGFGTNRSEASFLADRTRQREIAAAITDAAMDYLARYERRVGGTTPGGAP